MTIAAGQDILASDFIDTSAGAADAGKVPKLNADGQISKTMVPDWRTTSTTSSATPSIDTDTYNRLVLTAQVADITSMTSGLTGSPVDGERISLCIRTPVPNFTSRANSTPSAAAGGTFNITKPSGVVDGDIMFAVMSSNSSPSTHTAPAGWVQIGSTRQNGGGQTASVWYKVAASEGASYNFTFTDTISNRVVISAFYDASTVGMYARTSLINVTSDTTYGNSDTSIIAASMTTTYKNCILLFLAYSGTNNTYTPPTVPGTFTEVLDSANSSHSPYIAFLYWNGKKGATGDMNATMSGTSTNKHAWATALNQTVLITWGADFTNGVGNSLPSYVDSGTELNLDFVYNSAISKWVLFTPTPSINGGATTKDVSSTTTTTIAHGLGVVPKYVEINSKLASSSSISNSTSMLINGLSISNYLYADTGSGTGEGGGQTFRISVDNSNYIEGVITSDSTNISITWTKTGSPTGTANLIWKAEV